MKSLLVIIACIAMILVSCKEHPNDIQINSSKYLPHSSDSYWIYNNVILDKNGNPTGESYIDSVVYTGTVIKGEREALEFTSYRDKKIFRKNYYYSANDQIYIYDYFLNSFLSSDTIAFFGCGCADSIYKWELLVDFNKATWFYQESTLGDKYPSLVPEINGNDTTWKTLFSQTGWFITFNGEKKNSEIMTIMDKPVYPLSYLIKGNEIYRILYPDSIQFRVDTESGCEYFDNNRAIVSGRYELTLNFAENIGLIESYGKVENCKRGPYYHKRTLIRYKIN